MVAFQLPSTTKLITAEATKSIALTTKGEWKSLGLKKKVNLDRQRTILIMYNVNLKINNEAFSVRLRINKKFNVSPL